MKRLSQTPAAADIDRAASDWVVRRAFGLTPAEQEELARWEAADPRHAEALARHAQAWAMLDLPRQAGQGDTAARTVIQRVRRRLRWRIGAASAAVVAACLLIVLRPGPSLPVDSIDPAAGAVVLLPERRVLDDGTVVELDASAEIAVDFDKRRRGVTLQRGEAHFEVAKDPGRPFVVSAAGVEVQAVGTAFAVQVGDSAIEVLVTEGRVAIDSRKLQQPPAATAAQTAARLPEEVAAGHRAVISRADAGAKVESVPPAQVSRRLAWRSPRVKFSNTPLAGAAALMNRYSSVQIEIADPELAGVRVNGLFRADSTDAFVRLLEANFGASAERSADRVVLRRRSAP